MSKIFLLKSLPLILHTVVKPNFVFKIKENMKNYNMNFRAKNAKNSHSQNWNFRYKNSFPTQCVSEKFYNIATGCLDISIANERPPCVICQKLKLPPPLFFQGSIFLLLKVYETNSEGETPCNTKPKIDFIWLKNRLLSLNLKLNLE